MSPDDPTGIEAIDTIGAIMDIPAIINQVSQALQNAPEKAGELISDPRGTIEEIAGQTLGEGDLSQIVSGVQENLASGALDLSNLGLENLDLSALNPSNLDLSSLGGLGDLIESSPVAGIMDGLGSLFGRK